MWIQRDPCIEYFNMYSHIRLLVALLQSMHKSWYSRNDFDTLAEHMVHMYVKYVVHTFRDSYREYPRYDEDNNPAILLQ